MLSTTQAESAARHFCLLTGQSPDELVDCLDENGEPQQIPAWRAVLMPILEHMAMNLAIDAAVRESVKPAPPPLKNQRPLVRIVPFNGSDRKLRGK